MEAVTFKLEADVLNDVDSEADGRGDNRSEYLRHIVHSRHDTDDLRSEVEEYKNKTGNLRAKLRAANRENENVGKVVGYVEEERSIQRKREKRADMKAEAGVLTRVYWWARGGPSVESDDE